MIKVELSAEGPVTAEIALSGFDFGVSLGKDARPDLLDSLSGIRGGDGHKGVVKVIFGN